MKQLVIISILLLSTPFVFSHNQETVDSLKSFLSQAETDGEKYDLQMLLGAEFFYSKPDSSVNYFNEARGSAVKLTDRIKISAALLELARVNKSVGSYQIAMEYALSGLRWAEEENSPKHQMQCALTLAGIYALLGDYVEAKSYYAYTIQKAKVVDDEKGLAYAHIGIGNIDYFSDSLGLAEYHFTTALVSLEKLKDKTGLAGVYVSLGNVLRSKEDYPKSLKYYELSLEIYRELERPGSMALVHYNLGDIYVILKKYGQAKKNYIQSLRLGEQIGSSEDIKYAYQGLMNLAEESGNFEEALRYSNLYHDLKDSLSNESMKARVSELQVQYQSNKKEDELEETKQQLTDAGVLHRTDTIAFWASIIGGLIILIIAALFYNNLRKSKFRNLRLRLQTKHIQEKNRIIDSQLKDKDILLKEVHHRVKNNLQMISSLLNLQSQRLRSASAIAALQESKDRVQAIALIHKGLYTNDRLARVNIRVYLEDLITYHQNLQSGISKEITFETGIEDIEINLDTAVPLGLIISEMITNSVKHAFPGDSDKAIIKVDIKALEGLEIEMIYSDNGIGMPKNTDPANIDSLGLEIIESLVEQLDGKIVNNQDSGTQFHVQFWQQKV